MAKIEGTIAMDGVPLSTEIVVLDAETKAVAATGQSTAQGDYSIDIFQTGDYYVMAIPPEGYRPLIHGPVFVEYTGDPHWPNVVALLHFDDPNDVVKTEKWSTWYIHKTGSGFGEVTQNAAKFWVAGLKLNSPSGANYYFPATDGVILTGDIFTAEVFCMPRKLPSPIFTSFFGSGDSDQLLSFNNSGKIVFYRGSNALGGYISGEGVNQYTLNTYYHIAMTHDGTHIRVFVDGNKEIEIATSLGWTGNSSTRFGIGDNDIGRYNNSYRQATDIYFDELRITKGVARYTENFTPPNAPFPAG